MYRYIQLKWRRFKRGIEALFYGSFDQLVLSRLPPVARHEKRVAIVHLELLGDFILWLPYGQLLVRHLLASGNQVVLIIDSGLKSLARAAFGRIQILGIPKNRFLHSPRQRAIMLGRLRRLGVGLTLHPRAPRDAILMDAIVHALGARAIGFDAVFDDRPEFDRRRADRWYQTLLPALHGVHQARRHRAFLQALGVDTQTLRPVQLALERLSELPDPYWVIAPGASREFKQWPAERFAVVARHIAAARPSWRCIIVGSSEDRRVGSEIAAALRGQAIDLTGQTDLLALVAIIHRAHLVLGNDSAAGHIAAALGTSSVVVVGGGHWGRFFPYDPADAVVRAIPRVVSVPMPCFGCNWVCRYTSRQTAPFPCIKAITADLVIAVVEDVLSQPGASRA